jgi:hypothetical protein
MAADDDTQRGDGIEATLWRFLRELYLRTLTFGTLHPSKVMSEAEKNAALDPHVRQMEADLQVLLAVVERGQAEREQSMRQRLHQAEGIDHEMLDEALAWAAEHAT